MCACVSVCVCACVRACVRVCVCLESGNHVNVGPVSIWGRKQTEDDKHPDSDHPQCQHRKIALAGQSINGTLANALSNYKPSE